NNKVFYYDAGEYKEIDFNPKEIHIKRLKDSGNVIKKNTGASLIDVGDGVALLEFTSPNNSIGLDVIQMINQSIEAVEKNYEGMIIANQGKNFCIGANLALMLMEAHDDKLFQLDMVICQFHNMRKNMNCA